MSFVAVSAGIGAVSLGSGLIRGANQNAKAGEIERNNPRPTYTIPEEFKQNLAIAENMAKVGLPQQQYNNALNNIQRNQAGALTTLSRSANPAAGLATLLRGSNAATMNLDAQDAAARQANERLAMQNRGILGQQRLEEQQYNKFDKYSENFNQAQAYRGAANQNINNAFNGAAQLAGGLYGMGQMNGGYPQMTMGQYNGEGMLPQAQSLGFGGSNPNPFYRPLNTFTIQ